MKNSVIKYGIAATIALSPMLVSANTTTPDAFLEKALVSNPNISNVKVTVLDSEKVKQLKNWKVYNLQVSAKLNNNGKTKTIKESATYFSNGVFMTSNMTNMLTGEKVSIKPKFLSSFYTNNNLISGTAKSAHKIAIFSDPLCPFCREKIPKLLRILKRYPKEFAVYYYDFPLTNIHPASGTIVKINEALRLKNQDKNKVDIVLEMYDFDITPSETNATTILNKYNKQLGRSVTKNVIESKKIANIISNDSDIATKMSVQGTPTVFIDGKIDSSRYSTGYKKFLK